MPNCVENIVLLIASASIGAICVPINSRFRERELAHVIRDGGLRVLFTTDLVEDHVDFVARLARAFPALAHALPGSTPRLEQAPDLDSIVLVGRRVPTGMVGLERFEELADTIDQAALDERRARITGDQIALMLYTSGTTAMPKGCPLLHRQFVDLSREIAKRLGMRDGDRMWDALPMFHASGLLPMLATFSLGSSFYSQTHFDPEQALSILIEQQITVAWPAYATVWQPVLTAPGFDPAALSELRAILCVAPEETLQVMEGVLRHASIVNCYGITEASGVPVMADIRDPAEIRTGTCGLPFGDLEVEVRDPDTAEPLGAGTRGLLWLRGEYVTTGYWADPVKTAEVFDGGLWFCTGDLASLDRTGRVLFHGRLKDTLKVGGENVAAVEVEAFLTTHPAVTLVAVIGVPDAKYGEVPAAFVQLRRASDATADELIEYCKAGIAGFKVPRHVRFVTEWPMSATKIRKADLRGPLLEELGLTEPPR